jgi:putative phage-type endonuclease
MSHLLDNRRHNIVTASNAWASVNERQKLWRQMTMREPPFEGNEATAWGNLNEKNALSAFEKEMGEICEPGNKLIVHDSLPMGASADAYLLGDTVELKCPFSMEFYPTMPDRYYYQVQMQIHVCGRDQGWFSVWTPDGITVELVKKDDKWLDWYKPLLLEFMEFVETDVEPTRWKRKPIYTKE